MTYQCVCFIPKFRKMLYTDDVTLYQDLADYQRLQSALSHFINWCTFNSMYVNVNKFALMSKSWRIAPLMNRYSIRDSLVPRSDCLCGLGLLINNEVTLQAHFDNML